MGYVHYPDREGRDEWIRQLRASGMSYRAIAAVVGCHHITAWEAASPGAKGRHNARRAAWNTSPEGLERQRQYRRRKATT